MLTTRDPAAANLRATAIMGTALVLGYVVALAWAMQHASYDVWGALLVGPVLVAITVPILRRAAAAESDPWMRKVLFVAFAVKMAGSLVRYAVTFEVYGGRADAGGYHGSGVRLAAAFWDGTWDRVLNQEVPELVGTEFIRLVTGAVYIVTGPTKLGGFLVFGWLGFLGMLGFYRAFRVAFPDGDQRRYGLLLFFLPSLLYWPSSIGKESWMLFTLGIAAYGAALVLTFRLHGYLVLAIGLAGTAAVRPHVTLLTFSALFIAVLLRRRPWHEAKLGLLSRLAGLTVLVVFGAVILGLTADFFNVDSIDRSSVDQVLDRTVDQSAGGESSFSAPRLSSPSEYPYAAISVLFRPFPWEVGNPQAMVAALEGLFLMGLCAVSLSRLVRVPRFTVQTPYVAFALAYSGLFVLAFSAVANFGILARQRAQLWPFILVLLAVPAPEPARARRRAAPSEELAAEHSVS